MNIDEQIEKVLSKELKTSQKYDDTIQETFKKIKPKKNNRKLALTFATACCSLFIIVGTVFADNIDIFFQGLLMHNKGVKSAIENDFIERNHSEKIESSNIKTYIESVLMDDAKLCISLSFELPEEYAKNNIHRIDIPNIIVYDENNNILYAQFLKEINYSFFNNLKANEEINSYETSLDIGWAEKNGNTYSFSYIINSEGFPKSKSLNVKFDEINFVDKNLLDYVSKSYVDAIRDATVYSTTGEWILHYELSEKTYSRENYNYRIINAKDYKYNFPEEMVVTNTSSTIEFSYDLHDILPGEDILVGGEPYIKTENDVISLTEGDHGYCGYEAYCNYSFEVGTFNSTPTMQLIIPLDNGSDIVLELERIEN